MKKLIFPLAAAAFFFASCDEDIESRRGTNEQIVEVTESGFSNPVNGGFELSLNDKVAFGNLVIYPVYASNEFLASHGGMGSSYKTLKESVESGAVVVSEHEGDPALASHRQNTREQRRNYNRNNSLLNGTVLNSTPPAAFSNNGAPNESHDGPSVNSLSIENKGDDTVLVMAGELVQGGDQDRVVAVDMLLKPHSGKVNLPVFCVESNRWTHSGYYNNSTQFGFVNNFASSSIREIVTQKKDQAAVWGRVSEVTAANSASSSTNSYNALEKSKQFTDVRQQYLNIFENAFNKQGKIIGVVVADKNNNVMTCDIFCNPELFRKEYKGLVHSYVTEAISTEGGAKEKHKKSQPEKYFQDVSNEYKSEQEKEGIYKLIHKGAVVHYARF